MQQQVYISSFKQLLENYFFGHEGIESIRDIAIVGLQQGFDSPSLCILAGIEPNEFPSVVDYYIRQMIAELNIQLPDPKESALTYAGTIIDNICAGQTDVFEGTKMIIERVIHRHDWSEVNEFHCFDGIGFEKVYGLFCSYEDLVDATDWQPATSERLIGELKWELVHELKIWREKIRK